MPFEGTCASHATLCVLVLLQVWEERDRDFVAAGDLTMDDECLILLIDADTKVGQNYIAALVLAGAVLLPCTQA